MPFNFEVQLVYMIYDVRYVHPPVAIGREMVLILNTGNGSRTYNLIMGRELNGRCGSRLGPSLSLCIIQLWSRLSAVRPIRMMMERGKLHSHICVKKIMMASNLITGRLVIIPLSLC